MRGIPQSGVFIFILFIVLIEVISYLGILQLIKEKTLRKKVSFVYWIITIAFIILWMLAFFNPDTIREATNYQFFYFVISLSVLNIFPKTFVSFFVLIAAPFRLLRGRIVSKVIVLCGLILGLGMMLNIAYGILVGRKIIRVEEVEVALNSFPSSLDGLKIVQISDLHLGSFRSDMVLEECTKEINAISPDLLLFTGDMVNNYYQEMIGFEDQLSAMKAQYGKFAILGNHDYGDYSDWNRESEKENNHAMLEQKIEDAGFDLLLNESKEIKMNDTSFYVVGVENWGERPFPQYADLNEALEMVPGNSFQILMSHDPAYWEDKILGERDIPLTLSGHTHGGQFAFTIAGLEFSPMYFIQKYWGGLYEKDSQYLFVNRGFGCVGFLGRIDMAPEITVLTLRSK